ncbi:MAG: putative sulfate exporter family transporter [Verrucomicrobia bacterium]|nr:putative sulfate exporter family transporter [Verrucomicrobiota bacterium]
MNAAITPESAQSWSSMEGVPDWADLPASLRAPAPSRAATGNAGHRALDWLGQMAPGIVLAAALAWLAEAAARWVGTSLLGYAKSPISGVPVAIILGLLVCNTAGLPVSFKSGLRLCATTLLRTAIVLLGLRLSLGVAAGIGWQALPIVGVCVAGALIFVPLIGRWAGVPARLAALISVGTGICGVTAIVATAPALKAEEDEVSYAVACVAIFGMTAMLLHPWLAHLIFAADARAAGIFLGTAIHDTSQVAGAALTFAGRYSAPDALNVATVTKLMRNLCLAGAIPFVAWFYLRNGGAAGARKTSWSTVFPLFVLGFVAMTVVRTVGDSSARAFGVLEPAQWRQLLGHAEEFTTIAIAVVMASVGLQTDFSRFRRLGLRPLFVGFVAALAVGALSVAALLLARKIFST